MLNKQDKREISLKSVKMQNAGIKYPRSKPVVESISKERIDYPSIYLNSKQAPFLVKRDVEDNISLVINGKIVSHRKNERRGVDSHETFDIEIRRIGCLTPKK